MAKQRRSNPATTKKARAEPSSPAASVALRPLSAAQSKRIPSTPVEPADYAKGRQTQPAAGRRLALIPAALAILTSINALWDGYAADDLQQIVNNPAIKKLGNIPLAFTTSVWSFANNDVTFAVDSYYRPMFNLLFTLNYWAGGDRPWVWHLSNTLIHAAASVLVYLVASTVIRNGWTAVLAASLFAVHPAHAESVAWVSGITDPLMALFVLPAFLCYWRFRETGRRLPLIAMLVLFLLGLLCKETAAALPLMIAWCELALPKDRSPLRRRLLRIAMFAGLFALPSALYAVMRYAVLSGQFFGSGPRYRFKEVVATVPLAIMKYLKLLVIPHGYSYQHYTERVSTFLSVRFLVPGLILVAIAAFVIWLRSAAAAFCAMWFLIWLAPALAGMRQFEPEYLVQERYLYLPALGFCVAVALLLEWMAKRGRPADVAAKAVAAALLITFSVVLVLQNRVWNDTISLIRNCVAVEPDSADAHATLATNLFSAGRTREAEDEANKALGLNPQCGSAYLNLSYFAKTAGKLDKAIEYLERGVEAMEGVALSGDQVNRYKLGTILLNLGFLYERKKQPEQAERAMLRSVDVWPRAVGWYNVGQYYFDQGNYAAARDMYEKVLPMLPRRYAPIHMKLGAVYERLGDTDRARSEYEAFVKLAPEAPERTEIERKIVGL